MSELQAGPVSLEAEIMAQLRNANQATRQLAKASAKQKNAALSSIAKHLWILRDDILAANAEDVKMAKEMGMNEARLDRLQLTEARISQMIEGVQQLVECEDVIGEIMDAFERPNGLSVQKVRVPLGVIAIIYESRPTVTVDAAAVALKTGNCVVLRGGRDVLQTNRVLVAAMKMALTQTTLPKDAVQFIERVDHEGVKLLVQAVGLVDLAIPRGGAALIQRVIQEAYVPVIETGVGNCHIYVDRNADVGMARSLVINGKTQRPSVCNATETVLINEEIAATFLPLMAEDLHNCGVELRVCDESMSILGALWKDGQTVSAQLASDHDYETEFLALIVAVKIVKNFEEATAHIAKYGTKHSEVIVTEDAEVAARFLEQVDAAVVYHNASSRFTDGFEFGFGAEIGISTQKLHARGPMGLREVTSYKYIVHGNGQIRG